MEVFHNNVSVNHSSIESCCLATIFLFSYCYSCVMIMKSYLLSNIKYLIQNVSKYYLKENTVSGY